MSHQEFRKGPNQFKVGAGSFTEIIRTTSLSWHITVSISVLFLGFICCLCEKGILESVLHISISGGELLKILSKVKRVALLWQHTIDNFHQHQCPVCTQGRAATEIFSFVNTSQLKVSNGLQFCVMIVRLSRLEKTGFGEPNCLLCFMFQMTDTTCICWEESLPVSTLVE